MSAVRVLAVDLGERRIGLALSDPSGTLAAHYGTGGVHATDFRHDPEGARHRINGWVAEQTARRIQELLPQGSVTALTRLVLTNAIWFKGEWAEVFETTATIQAPFRSSGTPSAKIALMHHELTGARYVAIRADGSAIEANVGCCKARIDGQVSIEPDARLVRRPVASLMPGSRRPVPGGGADPAPAAAPAAGPAPSPRSPG